MLTDAGCCCGWRRGRQRADPCWLTSPQCLTGIHSGRPYRRARRRPSVIHRLRFSSSETAKVSAIRSGTRHDEGPRMASNGVRSRHAQFGERCQ
jgi:hypothetical protein